MECLVISLDAQLSAVDSLIDSMMLVEEDENGEQKDMLKVHHIPNPAFQRHFQVLWYSLYLRNNSSPITSVLGLCRLQSFKEEISFFSFPDSLLWKPKKTFICLTKASPDSSCLYSPRQSSSVLYPTSLSVPASSCSKPQHPTSPYGAMAEGCSWVSWDHSWKM